MIIFFRCSTSASTVELHLFSAGSGEKKKLGARTFWVGTTHGGKNIHLLHTLELIIEETIEFTNIALMVKLTDNLSRPLGKTFVNHAGQECWIVLVVILAGLQEDPTHRPSSSSSSLSSVATMTPHVVHPPPHLPGRLLPSVHATTLSPPSSPHPPSHPTHSHRAVQRPRNRQHDIIVTTVAAGGDCHCVGGGEQVKIPPIIVNILRGGGDASCHPSPRHCHHVLLLSPPDLIALSNASSISRQRNNIAATIVAAVITAAVTATSSSQSHVLLLGSALFGGGRSGTTMPVHLTDTCHWRPRLCIPSEFRRIPTEVEQKSPAVPEWSRNRHRNVL